MSACEKRQINKTDIRSIYALGAVLGLVESGSKNDLLHVFVADLTGKAAVSELNEHEARRVLAELRKRQQELPKPAKKAPTSRKQAAPGKASPEQQRYIWRLMYDLQEIDPSESATLGERLCAIIKKILGVSASPANPFSWITTEQASQLIDMLKRYIRSAHKRKRT